MSNEVDKRDKRNKSNKGDSTFSSGDGDGAYQVK